MEGLKSITFTLVMVGLFVLALITAGISFASVNDSNISIANDPTISSFNTNVRDTLGTFSSDVNDSQTSFGQTIPEAGGDSILMLSVASIWKTITKAPKLIYSLVGGLIFDRLFGDAGFYIFFTTIGVFIVVTIIFYSWRWIKSGEP